MVTSQYGPTGLLKGQLAWDGRMASVVYGHDALDRVESWSVASEGTTWSHFTDYDGATMRVAGLWWQELPVLETHTVDYVRMSNGWISQKTVDTLDLQYEYDGLGRVIQLSTPGGTLEEYAYDVANNLTGMMRDGEGVWNYGAVPQFNEAPGRAVR